MFLFFGGIIFALFGVLGCADLVQKKKKYTGHIPPITHPWKQASYLAYLYNNKRTEEYAYN